MPQLRDNRTPTFGTYCAYADGDDDMCTSDAAAQAPSETHTFVGENYVLTVQTAPFGLRVTRADRVTTLFDTTDIPAMTYGREWGHHSGCMCIAHKLNVCGLSFWLRLL